MILPHIRVQRLTDIQEIRSFRKHLQNLTQRLHGSPYDPSVWVRRSDVLLSMGYPELATSDAYKALMLIRKSRNPRSSLAAQVNHHISICQSSTTSNELQRSAAEQSAMLALARALLLANCLQESLHYALLAIAAYPKNIKLRSVLAKVQRAYDRDQLESETDENLEAMDALEEREYRRSGHILSQSYPWMKPDLFSRGADLNTSLQRQILRASWSQCRLEQSTIREGMPSEDRSDGLSEVFGVMATKDIARKEMLLIDHTAACAVDDPRNRCSCCCAVLAPNPVHIECCSTRYCSRLCTDHALATYHLAVCGKDLSTFEKAYRENSATPEKAADELLFLRVLASAVQHSTVHPLHTPLVNQLTAMYDGNKHLPFDCETNIIRTFEMLTCLGVDIFANHNFDTWVLQTLRARIGNNAREYSTDGHAHIAINPLYSFFNHSCEPNVKWEDDKSTHSSSIRMHTLRSVTKGEELFINYHEELSKKPYLERRKILRQWLGSDCQCKRCVAEEAADRLRQGIKFPAVRSQYPRM
jgi:hypothetical protein